MARPQRIIDAHHHLWDLGASHRYPWLMEKGIVRFFGNPAPIQHDYLVTNFRKDIGDIPVTASVHIQVGVAPGDEVAETQWLQQQQEAHGLPSAVVAFCDLTAPDLAASLDTHQQSALLRGVRQIVGRSAEEDRRTGSGGLLGDPCFLTGLHGLAERELSFDLQLIPAQMERASQLFASVPELRVALCHAGSLSDFSVDGCALWQRGIRLLAQLPNMICKFSGFGMFNKNWSAHSVREQFDIIVDVFGPRRIAFGSNFPVDKLAMSYDHVWQHFFDLTQAFADDEIASMYHDTAAHFYRIPEAPNPHFFRG